MIAFYNEIDDYCCAWLSNLMDAGLITPGIISNESIEDITPAELIGYDRVHLFAGIGVWDYALRLAGWPSNRSVWTLSCPCQPFSSAGKGAGFDDERHLWPAAFELIRECKPVECLGEQVASGAASAWIDLVHADLEAMGYAFGCVPFPSAGVGAPHIRDRAYWVADSNDMQPEQSARQGTRPGETQGGWTFRELAGCGHVGGVVQPNSARCEPGQSAASPARHGDSLEPTSAVPRPFLSARELAGIPYSGKFVDPARNTGARDLDTGGRPDPTNGAWADADWLFCRDGKWRPVEPGTFPLAHGVTNRVGKLRAYGNAINAQAAKTFIESYLEC